MEKEREGEIWREQNPGHGALPPPIRTHDIPVYT